jgi:hypothetical protein
MGVQWQLLMMVKAPLALWFVPEAHETKIPMVGMCLSMLAGKHEDYLHQGEISWKSFPKLVMYDVVRHGYATP